MLYSDGPEQVSSGGWDSKGEEATLSRGTGAPGPGDSRETLTGMWGGDADTEQETQLQQSKQ